MSPPFLFLFLINSKWPVNFLISISLVPHFPRFHIHASYNLSRRRRRKATQNRGRIQYKYFDPGLKDLTH
ncbi:unnamed protein product [Coffea canephora]|uniref:DH200=94 genomic scaffold, scaffold_732 n=1 Tax=Coffea canephora TaxID=49390 RepID=A0A068VGK4_COFCA|nr:unnamed protein product [Coffea canephora]